MNGACMPSLTSNWIKTCETQQHVSTGFLGPAEPVLAVFHGCRGRGAPTGPRILDLRVGKGRQSARGTMKGVYQVHIGIWNVILQAAARKTPVKCVKKVMEYDSEED